MVSLVPVLCASVLFAFPQRRCSMGFSDRKKEANADMITDYVPKRFRRYNNIVLAAQEMWKSMFEVRAKINFLEMEANNQDAISESTSELSRLREKREELLKDLDNNWSSISFMIKNVIIADGLKFFSEMEEILT